MKFSVSLFKGLKYQIQKKSLDIEILTNSMEPVLKVGEKVVVSKLEDELKVFDIIVFYNPLIGLVCHYVISYSADQSTVVTRGLKEFEGSDIPIKKQDILGVVTSHKLGFFRRGSILVNSLLRKIK